MSRATQWTICGLLLAIPLLLIAWKSSPLPGASTLAEWISFQHLPHEMRSRCLHLLFTPVGALVVVFVRLTLGIRVLGPFRSVLLAIAFQVTGALVGMAFFALVIGVVVLLRPTFKSMRLAFFGRSAAMLSAVAGIIVLAMLVGILVGIREVEKIAYFPVVVLTLAGDAFASTTRREGHLSAIWRAAATAVTALVITGISSITPLRDALLAFPELLLAVLAGVIAISSSLKLRLFQGLNPPPKKKKRKKPAEASGTSDAAPVGTKAPGDPAGQAVSPVA